MRPMELDIPKLANIFLLIFVMVLERFESGYGLFRPVSRI